MARLSLFANPLGDAGLAAIAPLLAPLPLARPRACDALESLDLGGVRAGPAGVGAILDALDLIADAKDAVAGEDVVVAVPLMRLREVSQMSEREAVRPRPQARHGAPNLRTTRGACVCALSFASLGASQCGVRSSCHCQR